MGESGVGGDSGKRESFALFLSLSLRGKTVREKEGEEEEEKKVPQKKTIDGVLLPNINNIVNSTGIKSDTE